MTAEGKITTTEITRRPLGSVRVLLTTSSRGALAPASRKTGAITGTVTGVGSAAGNRRTRYELTTEHGLVAGLTGSQTFWLAPDAASTPSPDAPASDRITVKQLRYTAGVRVLITDQSEYAGGGRGTWRVAGTPRLKSWQSAAAHGEPCSIHAATVTDVRPRDGASFVSRYDVVTNLGTVEHVTLSQPFRLAPAGMRDTADIRAEMTAYREQEEARRAYNRANPRDVDGVNVAPGDLVELLGSSRWYTPSFVVRAVGASSCGFLVVPHPYARSYGEHAAGSSITLGFRRLADQDGTGGLAVRSCGCPAPIRETLIPPPPDGDTAAWRAVIRRMDVEDRDETAHRSSCHWWTMCDTDTAGLRVLPDCDDDGRETFTVHTVSVGANDTCGCPDVARYSGDLLFAADRVSIPLVLFPPQHHPDRDGLADRVTFAGCVELPDTAAPFVSAWAGELATTEPTA